jgi:hypothetical protein
MKKKRVVPMPIPIEHAVLALRLILPEILLCACALYLLHGLIIVWYSLSVLRKINSSIALVVIYIYALCTSSTCLGWFFKKINKPQVLPSIRCLLSSF